MGFDQLACAQVALGVSEIANNVIRYGVRGTAQIASQNNNRILTINFKDEGPGFKDLAKAKQEGFSSKKTSLGIGLNVAERAFDRMTISSSDQGATIQLEKHLPFPDEIVTYGKVSIADERYLINGDLLFIIEYEGDKILFGIIDGAGQGELAHEIATLVHDTILQNFSNPLPTLLLQCDQALRKSRSDGGAAISLCQVIPGQLTYLGLGDTHCYLQTADQLLLLTNNEGRLGEFTLPSLKQQILPLTSPVNIICCTDGINTRIPENLPSFEELSPQDLAYFIFNNYHRTYGDATVLVTHLQAQLL